LLLSRISCHSRIEILAGADTLIRRMLTPVRNALDESHLERVQPENREILQFTIILENRRLVALCAVKRDFTFNPVITVLN
jgi:hypothetical protein